MNQEETEKKDILEEITEQDYKYGFVSDIDVEEFPKGLSEDIVRMISARKNEPEWFALRPIVIGLPLRNLNGGIWISLALIIKTSPIWPSRRKKSNLPVWMRLTPN